MQVSPAPTWIIADSLLAGSQKSSQVGCSAVGVQPRLALRLHSAGPAWPCFQACTAVYRLEHMAAGATRIGFLQLSHDLQQKIIAQMDLKARCARVVLLSGYVILPSPLCGTQLHARQ